MGCGMSRGRYQYEISDDPYYQNNTTLLQPMGPGGPGPRFGPGRRFGPGGCHGPPGFGPGFRRGGCHRRPPWAQQQGPGFVNGPPNGGYENGPQGVQGGYKDDDRHDFAAPAPIPDGFKQPLTAEKEDGKGDKGEYRDHVEDRKSVPPRYSFAVNGKN